MTIDEKMLKEQLVTITEEVITAGNLKKGDLFVLGCTTSEVVGGVIGKKFQCRSRTMDCLNLN